MASHVTQIVQHLKPGGLEHMVLELLRCSKYSAHMNIISLEGNANDALAAWPQLKSIEDKLIFIDKPPGFSPKLIFQLAHLLRTAQSTLIHTHHIGPFLYGGLAARLAKCRHVHTEHDAWHYQNYRHRLWHKAIMSWSHPYLIADANQVAATLNQKVTNKKIHVIKNGIDTSRFCEGNQRLARRQFKLPQEVVLIGCSGRLEPVKGQKYLIEALNFLPSNYHVALAGTGSELKALQQIVNQHRLHQRIHFLNYVSDMPSFYQSLDLFCLPSLNEGFPLATLEAQACGIRTVASAVGAVHETLCPQSSMLSAPAASNDIAQKCQQLLQTPYINPRNFIIQHGDIKLMVNQYDKVFDHSHNVELKNQDQRITL